MEAERKLQLEKRDQERNYLKKMLIENENNKRKQEADKLRERDLDVQAQEEYARVIEKQEQDRTKEFQARERRAQEFMNRMAGTVIKNQAEKQRDEDNNMQRYAMEREMRMRMEEQKKAEREAIEKAEMRALLAKQMEEKERREQRMKGNIDEQAVIWARDKENYEFEEKRLAEKIKKINEENAAFLHKQMREKEAKNAQRKMSKQEFQLNKPLLREIQQKRKVGSEIDKMSQQ